VFRLFKTIFKKTGLKKFVTCNETWTLRHDSKTEQSGKFQILNQLLVNIHIIVTMVLELNWKYDIE